MGIFIGTTPKLVPVYIHDSFLHSFVDFYQNGFFLIHRNKEATVIRTSLELVPVFNHASFYIFFQAIFVFRTLRILKLLRFVYFLSS